LLSPSGREQGPARPRGASTGTPLTEDAIQRIVQAPRRRLRRHPGRRPRQQGPQLQPVRTAANLPARL